MKISFNTYSPRIHSGTTLVRFSAVIPALILLCCGIAHAQSLTVFDIDTTAFPVISAKMFAFDPAGNPAQPSATEIGITEDAVPRTVLGVTCPPPAPARTVSLAISIDVSGSMLGSDFGQIPIDLGKRTMQELAMQMRTPPSEIALQTCNDKARIVLDFTTDRARILSAIAGVRAVGRNDFAEQLNNRLAGLLNVASAGRYARAAVMYTDAVGGPLTPAELQACKDTCAKYGIVFYAVIFNRPEAEPDGVKASLSALAAATGGRVFDGVTTQATATSIAALLQQMLAGDTPCRITWQSDAACVPGPRALTVGWNGATAQGTYTLPSAGLASLRFNPPFMHIAGKPLGLRFDTTITVTALNAPLTVTGITSSNPGYDINPKTFTLAAGQSRTVTVSYTPPDSGYSWTRFSIATTLCPQLMFASGGYPGARPQTPTLKLTQPNGGEIFGAGGDTVIAWSGVSAGDTVRLEYSTDAGNTWVLITSAATGLRYVWRLPNTSSARCLVRVRQISTDMQTEWARRGGGINREDATAIAVDTAGNVYVTGVFQGTVSFGGPPLTEAGNYDIYLAKYTTDGALLWARRFGDRYQDYSADIAVDPAGNVYMTGYFNDTTDIGGVRLTGTGGSDIFLAKIRQDGSVAWARSAGGNAADRGAGVAVDAAGNPLITGSFEVRATFQNQALISAGSVDMFVAKYLSDGSLAWVQRGGGGNLDAGNSLAIDALGNVYVLGRFFGATDIGGVLLSSAGDQDMFVVKYRSDGSLIWAQRGGGAAYDEGTAIAVDMIGNFYVTGRFGGSATMGGSTVSSQGLNDMFAASFLPDGTARWAVNGGGAGEDGGNGIVVDRLGAAYVTGYFSGIASFSGSALTTRGGYDAFVVRYRPDGTVDWTRRGGGGTYDNAAGIALNPMGKPHVTGSFNDNAADFAPDTLSAAGGQDVFVWKLKDEVLQSDVSDSLFAIVMPQAITLDLDMGKVLVGSLRDSAVAGYIRNTGSLPLRVDSMRVEGVQAAEFAIVSGPPPFVLPPNASRRAEFRFRPSSVGLKAAQVRTFTQNDSLAQGIRGEGIPPTLALQGSVVDFGQVGIGQQRDTALTVAIQNIGPSAVDFTGAGMLGPDQAQFALVSGGGAFTLAPGQRRTVTLRFAPRLLGRTSGSVGFDYNGVGTPAVIDLFGQGVGGMILIDDDSATAGEQRAIALRMFSGSAALQGTGSGLGFRARVAYNRTLLSPLAGVVAYGARFDTVTVSGQLGADDVLARLSFITMLGDSEQSPLQIAEFVWLDSLNQPVGTGVATRDGVFHLLGICRDGGSRLYNPTGRTGILKISPNPATGRVSVDVQVVESGRTSIRLMDMLGRVVAVVWDGELGPGRHTLNLSTAGVATGSYYILLSTPTLRRVQRVDVIR